MRLLDMKYIGFKLQRENKQNSDNDIFYSGVEPTTSVVKGTDWIDS